MAALGVGLAGGSFSVGVTYVSKFYLASRQGAALGIFGAGNVGAAVTKLFAPFSMVAFGWHVLRLQRRIEGRVLPLEIVRDRIGDMLEARSWSVAAARYVAGLAAASHVEGILMDSTATASSPCAEAL